MRVTQNSFSASSNPSLPKKAEPFKLWLAKVGSERIDEEISPELAIVRAVDVYRRKGYSEEWINQRMLSIKIRNGLTDEWQKRSHESELSSRFKTENRRITTKPLHSQPAYAKIITNYGKPVG